MRECERWRAARSICALYILCARARSKKSVFAYAYSICLRGRAKERAQSERAADIQKRSTKGGALFTGAL